LPVPKGDRSGTKPRDVDEEFQAETGYNAWLGGEEPQVNSPDVADVRDVRDASSTTRAPQGDKKRTRIAGPKWDPELLQQARDAVLFLRQKGRPTMALTEALDEAMTRWLDEMRKEHNGGEPFPSQGGLR
jgi:hypothetical protein